MTKTLTVRTLFTILLCGIVSLFASVLAAQQIVIDADTIQTPIAQYVEYYEDSSETLTIEEVLAPNFDVNFIPHTRDILHFGMTSSAYWVRFQLDWSEAGEDPTRVLEFGPPKLVGGVVRG